MYKNIKVVKYIGLLLGILSVLLLAFYLTKGQEEILYLIFGVLLSAVTAVFARIYKDMSEKKLQNKNG